MNKNTEALSVYDTLKLALEALELNCSSQTESPATKAMAAIREALAEQPAQQEPVACPYCKNSATLGAVYFDQNCAECVKRMTSPPASKPLTKEEIERIYDRYGGNMMNCTRAIERAHGIKGDA